MHEVFDVLGYEGGKVNLVFTEPIHAHISRHHERFLKALVQGVVGCVTGGLLIA